MIFNNFRLNPKETDKEREARQANYQKARELVASGQEETIGEALTMRALGDLKTGLTGILGEASKANAEAERLKSVADIFKANIARLSEQWGDMVTRHKHNRERAEILALEVVQARADIAQQEEDLKRYASTDEISTFTVAKNLGQMITGLPHLEKVCALKQEELTAEIRALWDFAKTHKLPNEATEGLAKA